MDNSADQAPAVGTTGGSRGRGCGCWILVLVILLLGGGATALFGATFALRQEKALEPEAVVADLGKRYVMVPGEYVDWKMPASFKDAAQVSAGRELFKTECSMCHGQGAKGDAPLGRAQFPPAADLTSERTQSKTDGQLFYLIWHGVNYTGMPAWGSEVGGPNDQTEIWQMVSYLRTTKSK
jgi:mono/diheme cytochrome c family protein